MRLRPLPAREPVALSGLTAAGPARYNTAVRRLRACGVLAAMAVPGTAMAHGLSGVAGLNHTPVVEVEIPAGALPPGPAVAETESRPGRRFRHSARINILAADEPTRARLWVDWPEREVMVVVRSASGPLWRAKIHTDNTKYVGAIFVGSADELAAFARALRALGDGKSGADPASGYRLLAPEDAARLGCDALAVPPHRTIVAHFPVTRESHLLGCAARGVRLVAVGSTLAKALGRLPTAERPWGLGSVAWADTFEQVAPLAGSQAQPGKQQDRQQESAVQQVLHWPRFVASPGESRRGWSHQAVLAVLGVYIVLVVVCGIVVSRRPRRPWVAWAWFPITAAVATGAIALAGTRWEDDLSRLELRRAAVLAPSGEGVERTFVAITGLQSRVYALKLPWRERSLLELSRQHRFGSPFARSAGQSELVEDAISGTLDVRGLAIGRLGQASIDSSANVQRPVPTLQWRDGDLWAVNTAERGLVRAVICTAAGAAAVDGWQPGEARRLALRSGDVIGGTGNVSWAWAWAMRQVCASLEADSFALLVEDGERRPHRSRPAVIVTPPVPVEAREADLVLGPLPPREATP